MYINQLVNITSRAWSLKILALLHEGVPARQAPLLAASQAGRTAFRSSLEHLIDLKLLQRNPGYGHPLRPEYKLTKNGEIFARLAFDIMAVSSKHKHSPILIKKSWTIPVLSVTNKPKRFIEIKSALPLVTDRALSQSLELLNKNQWLERDVDIACRPPRPIYQAKNTGLKISEVINSTAF